MFTLHKSTVALAKMNFQHSSIVHLLNLHVLTNNETLMHQFPYLQSFCRNSYQQKRQELRLEFLLYEPGRKEYIYEVTIDTA